MGYYYNMNLLIILHIILNSSLLLLLIPIVSIQDSEITYNCSGTGRLYVADSNYSQSLTYLVDDLCRANAPKNNGFRNASWAEDENNRAYGLANCRGDVSNEDCKACLVNATISVNTNSCPYSKGAIIWRDYCQLKYSDVDFRGEIDEDYVYSMANEEHSIGLNDDAIATLLSNISSHIDVNTLFDNGSADVGGGMILYGMVQCTGDLSKDNCTKCLEDATKYIDATRVGARLVFGSCNVRYEMYQFLN